MNILVYEENWANISQTHFSGYIVGHITQEKVLQELDNLSYAWLKWKRSTLNGQKNRLKNKDNTDYRSRRSWEQLCRRITS